VSPRSLDRSGLLVGCWEEDLTMRKPTAAVASAVFFVLAPGVVPAWSPGG